MENEEFDGDSVTDKKSLILRADDLEVGQLITILQWHDPRGYQGVGDALKIKAIEMPFLVLEHLTQHMPPITLDTRQVDLMRVSEEFVKAQTGDRRMPTQQQPQSPVEALFGMMQQQPRRRP